MVVTITINPIVERRLYFDKFESGKVNRTEKEKFRAGGKGINVSRQLNNLGIKNTAVTFLGGDGGKLLRRTLKEEKIEFSPVQTGGETRQAWVAVDQSNKKVTSLFAPNSDITQREADDFLDKSLKVINNASVVVLAGSSPSETCDHIFPEIIKAAINEDKSVVADTYGKHLEACINAGPTALHINRDEAVNSLGITLDSEEEYRNLLSGFYDRGIKLSFVTNGNKPFYSSKFDFHYKIGVPAIEEYDSTGSGDAFVAGIVYGMEKALVYDEFTNLAVKLGALNATSEETCMVKINEIESFNSLADISPVGKKMKIIDDSPTIY
ncbi:MAG: tagatose-6-phosphate kinase [Melioribacteraceae bacterium]|nr:MAG: tagatose-6-phosphate kinase [Melioribacteraceae bacterium]